MATAANILIIDDEKRFCTIKTAILKDNGYQVTDIQDAGRTMEKLKSNRFDLVLLDLNIKNKNGIDVLREIKEFDPDIEVIMITGFADIQTAVKAIKLGAYDYLPKESSNEELLVKIDQALCKRHDKTQIRNLKDALSERFSFSNIIGNNKRMQDVYALVKKVCDTDVTVLITGETGTGKELIAKAIHFNSQRKDKPFIPVNCAAISEHLMESELFGHEKGAFTDAHKQRIGKIEVANGGTLFLDEIGDMSPNLQAKLLRFLQDKTFQRVGGNENLTADVRILVATNRNLPQLIKREKFREDLYYRINVMNIALPPLRERMDDLPLLIKHFINQLNIKFSKTIKEISPDGIKMLAAYKWPGNIRELENLLGRLVLTADGDIIEEQVVKNILSVIPETTAAEEETGDGSIKDMKDKVEKEYLEDRLKKYYGNISKVAKECQVDRRAIYTKMKKYGLKKEDF